MISIYDTEGVEEVRHRTAVQPHQLKLFRNALFKNSLNWSDALKVLPENVRSDFHAAILPSVLEMVECHHSKIDNASKLVFRTRDGFLIESVVLRPATGRTSLCISSQIGCSCQCSFCATGKMGFSRNLDMSEILDQVLQAARFVKTEGRKIRNVVFMGMGEPLLNINNLKKALTFLCDSAFFNYSDSRLMVSTVGIPQAMRELSDQFPKINLALSLHSARQDKRESLMPQAKMYTLDKLREVLIHASCKGTIMIEYLMLDGINDQESDLLDLVNYLRDIPVHINIIPFNEYEGCSLKGSSKLSREAFANHLKACGFNTTLRYSFGADVAAACGQLVQSKKGCL